jgi:hypothetical protein
MGVCCNRSSGNKAEDFIREVLDSMKIRKMKFEEFEVLIQTNEDIKILREATGRRHDNLTSVNKFFERHLFDNFENNEMLKFQKTMQVEYDEMSYFYTLYSWAFTFFVEPSNKHKFIKPLLERLFGSVCSPRIFKDFIIYVIQINIVENNKKIFEEVQKNFGLVRTYKLDEEFKQLMADLIENVYSTDNLQSLNTNVICFIDELCSANSERDIFNEKMIKDFYNKFPFIFDCIELREYIFSNFFISKEDRIENGEKTVFE